MTGVQVGMIQVDSIIDYCDTGTGLPNPVRVCGTDPSDSGRDLLAPAQVLPAWPLDLVVWGDRSDGLKLFDLLHLLVAELRGETFQHRAEDLV
jgi:hypothetical protein